MESCSAALSATLSAALSAPLQSDAARRAIYVDDIFCSNYAIAAIADKCALRTYKGLYALVDKLGTWHDHPGNQKVLRILAQRSELERVLAEFGVPGEKKEPLHLGALDGNLAPLHFAAIHDAPILMAILVARLTDDELNIRCAAGRTPLSYVVEGRNIQTARLLLKRLPADQLAVQDCDGRTPMHHLVQQRHHDMTEMAGVLLGCHPVEHLSIQDVDGCTPLHLLVASKHGRQLLHPVAVLKLLLDRLSKSQLALRDRRGRTALHTAACNHENPFMLNMLLPRMEHVAALQDCEGNTPAHLALRGCAAAIPRLLSGGSETKTINSHVLQFSNSKALATCLTAEQLNITNHRGKTPADLLHDLYHPVLGPWWLSAAPPTSRTRTRK